MIDEQLSVVHAIEDLHMYVRANRQKVFYLRLGGKGLLGAIPEMDIIAVDAF